MNLPKFVFNLFFLLFSLLSSFGFSQKDPAKKWLRFSIDEALIINKTFSHFEKANEKTKWGETKLSPLNNTSKYFPGLSLGCTSIWGNSLNSNIIFGVSVSLTQAKYKRYERYYEPGTGLAYKKTESSINSDFLLIHTNFELGYKFLVYKKLFFQPSLLIHYNKLAYLQEKQSGKIELSEQYYTDSALLEKSSSTINVNATKKHHDENHGSIRLTAFYKFKIEGVPASVFVFRNIGIKYKLPWWGIGYSIIL